MRLMRTGAKLRAELSVSLPAELKTGETETTGCICCGLFFFVAGKSSACKAKLPEAPRYSAACKKNPTKICTSQKIWYTIYVSEKARSLPKHKTDSPSEFLSFYVCAAAERRGLFAAGRIRHTVCVNTHKKKKGKKSDENNTTRRKSNRVY